MYAQNQTVPFERSGKMEGAFRVAAADRAAGRHRRLRTALPQPTYPTYRDRSEQAGYVGGRGAPCIPHRKPQPAPHPPTEPLGGCTDQRMSIVTPHFEAAIESLSRRIVEAEMRSTAAAGALSVLIRSGFDTSKVEQRLNEEIDRLLIGRWWLLKLRYPS